MIFRRSQSSMIRRTSSSGRSAIAATCSTERRAARSRILSTRSLMGGKTSAGKNSRAAGGAASEAAGGSRPLAGRWGHANKAAITETVRRVQQSAETRSAAETQALGAALGRLLRSGDVVTLSGPMGAGKTALAQGIAAGLGVDEPVCSPPFALLHEYEGRLRLWHFDAYRLRTPAEALDLGLEELLASDAALVIEWPEQLGDVQPQDRLEIQIQPGEGDPRTLPPGARAHAAAARSPGWADTPRRRV